MSNDLCFLSAIDATHMFRSRELSPVELLQALITQSERVEADINAFSDTFFEKAMAQARVAENRYARGEPAGVLDGVAVAIKDEVDVKGQRNTEGSLIYENRMAEEDAILVARLRREGCCPRASTTSQKQQKEKKRQKQSRSREPILVAMSS